MFVDISQSGGYVSAVNWSPAIRSPFRALGEHDISLDKLLADRWVGNDEPALVMLHVAFPRASYADRGKSTVALPLPISIAVTEQRAVPNCELIDRLPQPSSVTTARGHGRCALAVAIWVMLSSRRMTLSQQPGDILEAVDQRWRHINSGHEHKRQVREHRHVGGFSLVRSDRAARQKQSY